MRTRRSPRNQEILWRALGGEKPAAAPRDKLEVLEACLAKTTKPKDRGYFERAIAAEKCRRSRKSTMTGGN